MEEVTAVEEVTAAEEATAVEEVTAAVGAVAVVDTSAVVDTASPVRAVAAWGPPPAATEVGRSAEPHAAAPNESATKRGSNLRTAMAVESGRWDQAASPTPRDRHRIVPPSQPSG